VITLKSELETQRRRHPKVRLVLLVVLVVFGALLAERWRGQWAVNRWKHRMAAKGEIFEANRIWPQPSAQSQAFSNELKRAVGQLPPGLSRFSGQISAIVVQEPGMARRGSQEPSPSFVSQTNGSNTWEELELEIRHAEPSLQLLRKILRDPPADMGYEILPRLESDGLPNVAFCRRAARALQAAVIFHLHQGDLEGANNNLVALAGFTKLYADDPNLVNYMTRIAILGLSTEVAWDALQADGWTDAQLATLQQAFRCDRLLAQMPRTIEAERAVKLFHLDWFSSHSYAAWVARFKEICQSFGQELPTSGWFLATQYYREWVFHPLWKFAWADQEELIYLKNQQRELDLLREASKTGSWKEVSAKMEGLGTGYRPPLASWRFYLVLPLLEETFPSNGGSIKKGQYPHPLFTRAWSTSMKNLTLCHMLTTAICLKRYELRHGKPPASLEALVPEFLAKVPRDYMDGQPLRYALRSDGSYMLYSVADDAQDDQGSPVPQTDDHQRPSPWNGRDWVWPQAVLVHPGPEA
jgi:hypothetical protein